MGEQEWELHVGLTATTTADVRARLADIGLRWARVESTRPLSENRLPGHGVDGELAWIGTADPHGDPRPLLRQTGEILADTQGCRIELESFSETATPAALTPGPQWRQVPAPTYEIHVRGPLADDTPGLTEITVFATKTISTLTAPDRPAIEALADHISHTGPIERVVGCWAPSDPAAPTGNPTEDDHDG